MGSMSLIIIAVSLSIMPNNGGLKIAKLSSSSTEEKKSEEEEEEEEEEKEEEDEKLCIDSSDINLVKSLESTK